MSVNPFLTPEDHAFVKEAEKIKEFSKDPHRKVGCVLSCGGRQLSEGWNQFPPRVKDCHHRLNDKAFKNKVITHAELSALAKAAREGIPVKGSTAYITFHPCSQCAGALITSGVTKVVCPPPTFCSDKWRDELKLASDVLYEAEILTLYYHPDYEP